MGLATLNNIVEKTDTLTDGLVGYWPLNEGKDNTVYDYSGNKQNGLLLNGPKLDTNKINFNNSGAVRVLNSKISFIKNFTKCIWVSPNTLTGTHQLISGTGSHQFYQSSAALTFWNNTTSNTQTNYFTLSNLIFVCMVFSNPSTVLFYKNGNLIKINNNFSPIVNISNIFIGNFSSLTEPFSGYFKEARIYQRVLSPFEIKKLYNLGLSNIQNTKSII